MSATSTLPSPRLQWKAPATRRICSSESAAKVQTRTVEVQDNGNQTKRITAFRQGTGGVFHRHGACRSAIQSAHSGACTWRECYVRARRSNGLAHTSARSDLDSDRRL